MGTKTALQCGPLGLGEGAILGLASARMVERPVYTDSLNPRPGRQREGGDGEGLGGERGHRSGLLFSE